MTERVIEAALTSAIAAAVVMVGAAAASWVTYAHAGELIALLAVAYGALSGLQHVSGLTALAPVEPMGERRLGEEPE
jgi:predicted anti-sigma-YlaC factor YlaD